METLALAAEVLDAAEDDAALLAEEALLVTELELAALEVVVVVVAAELLSLPPLLPPPQAYSAKLATRAAARPDLWVFNMVSPLDCLTNYVIRAATT